MMSKTWLLQTEVLAVRTPRRQQAAKCGEMEKGWGTKTAYIGGNNTGKLTHQAHAEATCFGAELWGSGLPGCMTGHVANQQHTQLPVAKVREEKQHRQ
jgi:hypothetical protein